MATSISITLNKRCRLADDFTGEADDSPVTMAERKKKKNCVENYDFQKKKKTKLSLTAYDMQCNGGRSTI